jgi:HlyD family secretion protein
MTDLFKIAAGQHHRTRKGIVPAFHRLLACTTALALILLPGCKKEAAPETVVTVQAEKPEQGPMAEHILADAILAPLAQAAIEPKITAPVRKFYVQRGAKVKEGELLATLENSYLAAASQENKGSYMASESAFATAKFAEFTEDVQRA